MIGTGDHISMDIIHREVVVSERNAEPMSSTFYQIEKNNHGVLSLTEDEIFIVYNFLKEQVEKLKEKGVVK